MSIDNANETTNTANIRPTTKEKPTNEQTVLTRKEAEKEHSLQSYFKVPIITLEPEIETLNQFWNKKFYKTLYSELKFFRDLRHRVKKNN